MFESISLGFTGVHAWVHQKIVQPLLWNLGAMDLEEWSFEASEWVLIGFFELVVMLLVFGTIERLRPLEKAFQGREYRTDLFYTALHRLGAFTIITYLLIQPALFDLQSALTQWGIEPLQLDQWVPGGDRPWVSFFLYLMVFDFVDYALHRGQHRWNVWWALHSVHHSQRYMTFLTDNRNHLLDDLVRTLVFAVIGVLVGVPPAQFVFAVVMTRMWESFTHINAKVVFPAPLKYILVSPAFHRHHHGVDGGADTPARGENFAVLFPIWDIVFRTANWTTGDAATGIRDQLRGRDYGNGFWRQQWLGVCRMVGR